MKLIQYIFYQIFFTWIVLTKNVNSSSENNFATKIIGGDVARAAQFSFAAAIDVETNDSRFFCGGSLLVNLWVLTAGHCVYNAVVFTIRLGSHELVSDDVNRVKVSSSTYILHPDFNPETIENDIGLIKLREVVVGSYYLRPVTLVREELADYSRVYALGWGQISDSDSELTNELRYVYIATITNAECQITYGNQITENMVCVVGNYNEGTCTGDNGGALVVPISRTYAVVGIASFISSDGCESTHPSGFTRISPYYDWINNITNEVNY